MTILNKLAVMSIPTTSAVKAIIAAKDKFESFNKEECDVQIQHLVGETFVTTSLYEAKYTLLYVIQLAIRIHQNKEDRMTNNELVHLANQQANSHIEKYELDKHPIIIKPSKVINVIDKPVESKTGVRRLDVAYDIVLANKTKSRNELIDLLVDTMSISKSNAGVYLSKVTK